MHLINTQTMLLEDFIGRDMPQYAILSHTWTEKEVSLQEFTCQNEDTANKEGFAKIVQTCRLARADGIRYAWIDTCCIDKTSSAELAEAINSMFQWYKNSSVCYVFLYDLPIREEVMEDCSFDHDVSERSLVNFDELRSCKWFTRGWTLQELIAPRTVRFYDEIWAFRGTKHSFADPIYQITHIKPIVLRSSAKLTNISIAEKMAWASRRETTRIEDIAYCLLGIFDVNMSLLYGEGRKAFTRLQQEIIKNSNDLSIFGWSPEVAISVDWHWPKASTECEVNCSHGNQKDDVLYGILATSPKEFVGGYSYGIMKSIEHSVTNRGIKIYCSLLEICLNGCDFCLCRCCPDSRKYVLGIGQGSGDTWGVVLEKVGPDDFIRSKKRLIRFPNYSRDVRISQTRIRAIYLLTQIPASDQFRHIPLNIREGSSIAIRDAMPDDRWNSSKRYWYIESEENNQWGIVVLEFDRMWDGNGVCLLFSKWHSGPGFELWSSPYTKEIGLVAQSSSKLDLSKVWDLFNGARLSRKTNLIMVSRGREYRAMGMGRKRYLSEEDVLELEVWTEKIVWPLVIAQFFSPRTAVPPSMTSNSITSSDCITEDHEDADSEPENFSSSS